MKSNDISRRRRCRCRHRSMRWMYIRQWRVVVDAIHTHLYVHTAGGAGAAGMLSRASEEEVANKPKLQP